MKLALASLLGLIAAAVSLPAAALPVHATFSGEVSGSSGFFTTVLGDVPVGTDASFDVTFDDSGLLPSAPLNDFDLAPVSGWVRLGGLEWLLDAGHIPAYSWNLTPGDPIRYYQMQLTGTGPLLPSGAAHLFGLFLTLTADLEPFNSTSLSVGFAYPVESGEFYSYADLAGAFTVTRGTTAVPEPGTTLPLLSLLLLAWAGRRYSAKVSVAR